MKKEDKKSLKEKELIKKAKKYETMISKIKDKLIINQEEKEIFSFFERLKCSICGKYPTMKNKNHELFNEIFCEDCYPFNKLKDKQTGDKEG